MYIATKVDVMLLEGTEIKRGTLSIVLFWLKLSAGQVAENRVNSVYFNFFQKDLKIILGLTTMQASKQ